MPAPPPPYFFEASLRQRFTQAITEAVGTSRITRAAGQWLRALVDGAQSTAPMPRVDRLLIGDLMPANAELASAFVISDLTERAAPVYLDTLLFGIERFDSRASLLAALKHRYPGIDKGREIDLERVEEPLFRRRSQLILEQQAAHLDTLSEQLHRMPTLQTAVGQALQGRLDDLAPHPSVNVFTQLVQIVNPSASLNIVPVPPVLATQTLADAAYEVHVDELLQDGLYRQYLDEQGRILDPVRTEKYVEAMLGTDAVVPGTYAWLMSDYWTAKQDHGQTMRQVAADALAETFRQELLRSQTHGLLSPFEYRRLRELLQAPGASAEPPGVTAHSIAVSVDGHPAVRLAGLLLLEFSNGEIPGLHLFSTAHGFARINHRSDLSGYFTDARSREVLLAHASVVDRAILNAQEGALVLQLHEVAQPVFENHVQDVIELQKHNLQHVLSLPSVTYDQAAVRVDDALDVRVLLDHRLLSLNGSWRWQEEAVDFDQVWGRTGAVRREPRSDLPAPADTWADRVDNLDALVARLPDLHVGISACMYAELNRYLAVIVEPGLDARALWIGRKGAASLTRVLPFALEMVSGAVLPEMPDDWVVQRDSTDGQYETVERLPISLFRLVLQQVALDFPQRYAKQVDAFYKVPVRRVDSQVSAAAIASRVRENALRLEVTIERRLQKVADPALDMLEQVLDRPVAALRASLGAHSVQAFTVALSFDSAQAPAMLSNAFVLFSPGKPDRYLMWAVEVGIGDFDSLRSLETQLAARLGRVDKREGVLGLMLEDDRLRLEAWLAHTDAPAVRVVLGRIDGHFIQALQAGEAQRQASSAACAYRDAAAWRLKSDVLVSLLDACEHDDINRRILGALRAAIQSIVDITIVPAWVSEASALDQARLLAALQRFYVACGLKDDFLFSIPTVHEYAHRQVRDQLRLDFRDVELEPDDINVTLTHYVVAPVAPGDLPLSVPAATSSATQKLTDFAVNRFFAVQEGTLTVAMADGSTPDPLLTPLYLRDLVRKLDVAENYLKLLSAAFHEDNPSFNNRQKRFAEQMPALDMLRALVMRLQNQLSPDAYRLIASILEMPDGLARLPVGGQYAMISPLRLCPDETWRTPATVLGTYVIFPKEPATGPWILYSLLGDFAFREYPDKAALLEDIHTSTTLQTYLLERIDESVRKIYDHGGFKEPHLPFSTESSFDVPLSRPRPVTLRLEPYEGNALELLFKGMLVCFPWRVRMRMITNDQERRSSSRYLFSLGAEQLLAFMPGRLGALVGIWQSQNLFNASAAAASERRWGKALSEFTAAVSMLITARHVPSEDHPAERDVPAQAMEVAPFVEFSWRNDALTTDLRNRLRAFEIHDVALNTLRKNELFNTYRDDDNGRVYVAISGAVYELEHEQGRWFIVNDDRRGPPVKLGADQRWVVDVNGGLKGGGGYVSRLKGTMIDREVDDILMVEAKGMLEIRRVSRTWADAVENGHSQARVYLQNCLDNLILRPPVNMIDPRAQRLIGDFFSHHAPDNALYASIRQAVTRLYEGLMDPSLSPQDSQRFVVGTNRRWHEPSSAFTFQHDPHNRIFLTEKYFRVPVYRLKTRVARTGSFNLASHYHAAILIHELTHQLLNTEDIAYVDSFAPYLDLLEDTPGHRLQVKNEQVEQQQQVLSYNTDRSKLFKQMEEGIWRDLRHADGDGKQAILRITGKSTLDQARDVFYTDPQKRVAVMMSNADSVALLVTLLGRERFSKRR